MSTRAASKGVLITLHEDASADETIGKVLAIPASITRHTFYVRSGVGVASGAVTFETADNPEYTGTWAPLVNDLETPTANPLTVPAASAEAIYTYVGSLAAVRARISTVIGGGTISVFYIGH